MVTIRIPTPLRAYTGGESEVAVRGETVGEALHNLTEDYPPLRQHIYNQEGELRPYVNLFVNEENVNDLMGIETPIQTTDRLLLIPSIAGGMV